MPRISDNLASDSILLSPLQGAMDIRSGVGCSNLREWWLAQCRNRWSAGQGELKERGCA